MPVIGQANREGSHILGKVGALLIGVGIGVGIGLGIGVGIGVLIAPASGEEKRADITDKVSDFSDKSVSTAGKGRRAQPELTANRKEPNPRGFGLKRVESAIVE